MICWGNLVANDSAVLSSIDTQCLDVDGIKKCDKDVHMKMEDSYECIGKMSYEYSAKVAPVPKDHCLLFAFQHVLICCLT